MPTFRISHDHHPAWPVLAWVATLRPGSDGAPPSVHVDHGSGVEWRDGWFGEAVWPGPFERGPVDEHTPLYGSAGVLRNGLLTFVPSWSNLDRLAFAVLPEATFVANTLPGLYQLARLEHPVAYPFAYRDVDGHKWAPGCRPAPLPTDRGSVEFAVAERLVWDGLELRRRAWPIREPAFADYDEYHHYVRDTLQAMAANLSDPARSYAFTLACTLSNGYDSTASAALGASVGARRAVSFVEYEPASEERLRTVAASLGLELQLSGRFAYQREPMAETLFLASGSYGYEAPFAAYRRELANTVLLSGYYGDRVWGHELAPLGPMQRRSQSGLSHTEFRLHAGYLHVPVPYIGCSQVQRIFDLGLDDAMRPWRVGEHYDRPVARRIAEDAGVPRGSFATIKLQSSASPRTRGALRGATARDFGAYLRRAWPGAHGALLARARLANRLRTGVRALGTVLQPLAEPLHHRWYDGYRFVARLRAYGREDYLFRYSFGWALEHVRRSYADLTVAEGAPPLAAAPGEPVEERPRPLA